MDRMEQAEQIREYLKPIRNILHYVDDACKRTIDEELGGYRGDGANDPDNKPIHHHSQPAEWSEIVKNINYNITELQRSGDPFKFGDGINNMLKQVKEISEKPENDKQYDMDNDCSAVVKMVEDYLDRATPLELLLLVKMLEDISK